MLRKESTREVAIASQREFYNKVDINFERKLQDNEQDIDVSGN